MIPFSYLVIGVLVLAAFVVLYMTYQSKPVPANRHEDYRRRKRRYDPEQTCIICLTEKVVKVTRDSVQIAQSQDTENYITWLLKTLFKGLMK